MYWLLTYWLSKYWRHNYVTPRTTRKLLAVKKHDAIIWELKDLKKIRKGQWLQYDFDNKDDCEMTITVMTLPFEPCICVKRAHHSITSPLFRYEPIIFYEPIIPLWDHYSRPTLFLYQPKFEVFLRTWVYSEYKGWSTS